MFRELNIGLVNIISNITGLGSLILNSQWAQWTPSVGVYNLPKIQGWWECVLRQNLQKGGEKC
jgi:hypothetical protein